MRRWYYDRSTRLDALIARVRAYQDRLARERCDAPTPHAKTAVDLRLSVLGRRSRALSKAAREARAAEKRAAALARQLQSVFTN